MPTVEEQKPILAWADEVKAAVVWAMSELVAGQSTIAIRAALESAWPSLDRGDRDAALDAARTALATTQQIASRRN